MIAQQVANSPTRLRRYETLDALRGLACLLVVAVHADFPHRKVADPHGYAEYLVNFVATVLSRGWVAPLMFFVISGYGISQLADSRDGRSSTPTNFLYRRFYRLYPPYLAALAVFSLVVVSYDLVAPVSFVHHAVDHPTRLSFEQWLGNITLTETVRTYVLGEHSRMLAGHFWTLYYEQQFYIVVALILLLGSARYFVVAAILTGLVLVRLLYPGTAALSFDGIILNDMWLIFAFGILVYWQVNYSTRRQWWLCNIGLLLIMLLMARNVDKLISPNWTVETALAFTAGFSLFLANLPRLERQIGASYCLKPLVACSTVSYSIYLIHPIVIRLFDLWCGDYYSAAEPTDGALMRVPVILGASIILGWGFYYAVERHFVKLPGRREQVGAKTH